MTSSRGANGRHVSLPGLADALGMSERTLKRLASRGIIEPARPGAGRRPAGWDPVAVARRLLAHRPEMTPRDRRDIAQAEYLELKVARERGELIPRAVYIRHGQQLAAAFTAQARGMPDRLVRAGILTTAQEPEALAAVDEMLRNIARWRDQDLVVAAGEPDGD